MKSYQRKLVLVGLYTFVLSALLGLTAVLLVGKLPSAQETAQWAERVSASTYTTSYYLLLYAYLIGMVGFWAVHHLFSNDKTSYLLSFWGMILAIIGSALPMASLGVSAFVYPALGRAFLTRGLDVIPLISGIFNPNTMIFLLFSGVYYLVGIALLSIVLWRNKGVLLKAASIALLLHGVLIIMPDQIFINLLSWVFLLLTAIPLIRYTGWFSTQIRVV